MVKVIPFKRASEKDLILIKAKLGNVDFKMALATGTSQTVIDTAILRQAGYQLEDSKNEVVVQSLSGPIQASSYLLSTFTTLGIEKTDFEVLSYDFAPSREYQGLLGLDFLRETKFCIDFEEGLILV